MSSPASFGSRMLFSMDHDLSASMAVADELSKEFNSLMSEASSSSSNTTSGTKVSSGPSSFSSSIQSSGSSSNGSPSNKPFSSMPAYLHPVDSGFSSSMNVPSPHLASNSPQSSPKTHHAAFPLHEKSMSDSHMYASSTHFQPTDLSFPISKNPPSHLASTNPQSSPMMHRAAFTTHEKSLSDSHTYASSTHFQPAEFCSKNAPSHVASSSPQSSPKLQRASYQTHQRSGSDGYTHSKPAPHSPRPDSPSYYERSPQGLIGYREGSQSPSWAGPSSHQSLLSPHDGGQMPQRSPQPERSPTSGFFRNPSPLSVTHPVASTLPRNYKIYTPSDEGVKRQKSPSKWSETDLDVCYERKPHHTYDKKEWIRPSALNSNWRESNLDVPPVPSPKKVQHLNPVQGSYSSLPRMARISVPPDVSPHGQPPYNTQPISSRVNVPPSSPRPRPKKPIPLSVIMRLQNPNYGVLMPQQPQMMRVEGAAQQQPQMMRVEGAAQQQPQMMRVEGAAQQHAYAPKKFIHQPAFQPHPADSRQHAVYGDALNSGDVDPEIQRLDQLHHHPVSLESTIRPGAGREAENVVTPAPRPLSPTRLQPMVAPEAQGPEIPDRDELFRIRAEIPRALKRRGSVDPPRMPKKASQYQSFIKLFSKKDHRHKAERGSDSSTSDDEESPKVPLPVAEPPPQTGKVNPEENKGYHSILRRKKKDHKSSGRRARLSPLVLLLDGALMGELDTVMNAVKEMSDPSQPNDEGITGLHNAICGGHYNVVDFLVRIGANVSAPDSHGWTPLHCAASCNDRNLCEFLVRNGAAVMAMTESDGATASQKCDPYAFGFEECENYLKGVEEAMGVENSGVLYALWSYQAQAADELSFKEGDMVTILQKPEGSDWWGAALCGREGLVPNNYFGLFPKVRSKPL